MNINRLNYLYIFSAVFFALLIGSMAEASDNRVKIGIVSKDAGVYAQMTSALTGSSVIQVFERRDLTPFFKELGLIQAGAVPGKPESLLKGIDYLIILDKIWNGYSARIVRVDTGQILVSWTGKINEIAKNCVNKLETEVALRNLSQIQNDEGIDVEINFSRDFYPAGSKVEFTVESSDKGYIYVLDVQPDGNIYVLVPNKSTGAVEVDAGEIVSLPGRLGFRMTAGKPYGIDTVRVIVAKRKIDIFRFGLRMGKNYTEVKGRDSGILSRGIILGLEKLSGSDWGIGSEQIRIGK